MQLFIPQWKVKLLYLGKSDEFSENMVGFTLIVGRLHSVAIAQGSRHDSALRLLIFLEYWAGSNCAYINTKSGRVKTILRTVKGKHYDVLAWSVVGNKNLLSEKVRKTYTSSDILFVRRITFCARDLT